MCVCVCAFVCAFIAHLYLFTCQRFLGMCLIIFKLLTLIQPLQTDCICTCVSGLSFVITLLDSVFGVNDCIL